MELTQLTQPVAGFTREVSQGLRVAVVGATGAVGGEFLSLFESRRLPVQSLRLLASERSVGKTMIFRDEAHTVELLSEAAFEGIDIAFFSAGATRSREFVPAALAAGARVIDNSSAFRMRADVPLVVPEVNPDALTESDRLLAVANCTAIILCVGIAGLRTLGRFSRLIVSTYQSASGGGAQMMHHLEEATRAYLDPTHPTPAPIPGLPEYAFNLFSHNTPILENGYNDEENKVIAETRKILGMDDLPISATCVRVPVLRAHSESVTLEFDGPAPSVEDVRAALDSAPGVTVVDDRALNHFPTPRLASHQNDVLVGRIRQDLSNPNAVQLFLCGDQLLKGAALNAVQIAELALEKGFIKS